MNIHPVSASIVAYKNDPGSVIGAIRSVLSGPLPTICTVVDNSPSPDLRQHVLDAGATYLHAGKNLGFGAGHNLVLRSDSSHTDYHLVLNPDVFFDSEVISTLYRFMNDNQDIGLVMPRILYPDGTQQHLCKLLPTPTDLIMRRFLSGATRSLFAHRLEQYELRRLDLKLPYQIPSLSGCFMFLRSSALREAGLFDERYFMYMEDVDLCRRVGKRHKTVFYPHVSITHAYAKGSYRSSKLLKHHVQSALRYFSKWGWLSDPERVALNRRTYALHRDPEIPTSKNTLHPIAATTETLSRS